MNLRKTGLVIRREYLNKVQKKSFLVTTLLVPILMAALVIIPVALALNSKEKTKIVAVVDRSGIVTPYLENGEIVQYIDMSDRNLDSVKVHLAEYGCDAVLDISPINSDKSVNASFTSFKPVGMTVTSLVQGRINEAVEAYRISTYGIEDLDRIMKDVKSDVRLQAFTMDEQGNEKLSDASLNSILSMVMGIIIFLFVTMFGSMVMTAVIEEKSSRVIEVLVSSVKATELMFGKIIGVALVAITQFLLWIVLLVVLVSAAMGIMGPKLMQNNPAEQIVNVAAGMGDTGAAASTFGLSDLSSIHTGDAELDSIIGSVAGLDFGALIGWFLVYFILGYLLYASLFAAVGSAVENEGDSQQLQMPLTIPLMIGYFIALYAFNAPDSAMAVWGSMIPFTSPIVMLARIPFGVPTWQILASVGLLMLTTWFCAWISAKIYKVGILMFGKKSTFADLWKWLKMK